LVTPPKPRQRATGTRASIPASSAICANFTVFGHVVSNTPSIVVMAQAFDTFVANVPSLNLLSLNNGFVMPRGSELKAMSSFLSVGGCTPLDLTHHYMD
jgi:hypothetical protein